MKRQLTQINTDHADNEEEDTDHTMWRKTDHTNEKGDTVHTN